MTQLKALANQILMGFGLAVGLVLGVTLMAMFGMKLIG